ncbi:unnamed protein product [Prorocentrum cordatum]|uniref:Uncharacterized protein n=1 Tax=Prorocentrum cordatum TaxID=2364126 RepID=A0ABN9PWB2_9DINO|nr:unnamed protein product [Polarella glacialis]
MADSLGSEKSGGGSRQRFGDTDQLREVLSRHVSKPSWIKYGTKPGSDKCQHTILDNADLLKDLESLSPNLSFNQEPAKRALEAVARDKFTAMSSEAIESWSEEHVKRFQGVNQDEDEVGEG